MWLVFLLLLGGAFLQATFLPLNLALILAVIGSLGEEEPPALALFVAGFLTDLITGSLVGINSLVFLLSAYWLYLAKNSWFFWPSLILVLFGGTIFLWYLQTQSLQVNYGLWTLVVGLVIWRIFLWLRVVTYPRTKSLEV